LKPKVFKDTLPNLKIFEAEDFWRLLPIIISFEEVEIADSYHKILGLTRIGDYMALS
jgi:hypothetical protein